MKKKPKVFKKPRNLKMSKRSEKALDESIEHWYRVRDEKELPLAEYCKLCCLYARAIKCIYCPVYLKAGGIMCSKTPYSEYNDYYKIVSEPKRKRLAQDEIDFLQSCYY